MSAQPVYARVSVPDVLRVCVRNHLPRVLACAAYRRTPSAAGMLLHCVVAEPDGARERTVALQRPTRRIRARGSLGLSRVHMYALFLCVLVEGAVSRRVIAS